MYVRGNRIFQGNYRAGFRDLRIIDAAAGTLEEVGFLDSQPGIDTADFSGAWSTYPFFQSGIVIGTDTNQGLFVLRPTVIKSTSQWRDSSLGKARCTSVSPRKRVVSSTSSVATR